MSTNFAKEEIFTDSEDPAVNAEITGRGTALGGRRYTFSLGRTYVTEGDKLARTGWLQLKHIPAIRRLLDQLEEKLQGLEAEAKEERKVYLERMQRSRAELEKKDAG